MDFIKNLFSWRPVDAEELDKNPYPERLFGGISLLLAIVGTVLAGWSLSNPALPPLLQLFKDVFIYGALLISAMYFFLRYRRAVTEVERQRRTYEQQLGDMRQLLNQQLETYQRLMSHTRDSFYGGVDASIYKHRFKYQAPGLTELLESSMDGVLTAVRKILESHFRARDIRGSVDISLSIKARVTGTMVKDLCALTPEYEKSVDPRKDYVITLSRDHDTRLNRQEREYLRNYYEIGLNTDFSRIFSSELSDFLCNDLKELEERHEYRNSSHDWHKFYNATQVVPIRYEHAGKSQIFGFLTVDSMNKDKYQLFNREGTLSIMTFGADLLALLFLTLEMYDKFAQLGGSKRET